MKKNKSIIYILSVFIIGLILGGIVVNFISKNEGKNDIVVNNNLLSNNKLNNSEIRDNNHKVDASMYSFETTDKNVISRELKGEYLDKLVTIAVNQEEFSINLIGIDSKSEVVLINPTTGDMIPLKYDNEKFSTKTSLEKDITYGVIINYKLSGSIRVVEDLNSIDAEQLFRDALISMGCGL
ncbi:hypothetical protein SAMN02745196_02068 [Clostridium collagenovorans DSM 3089]|uniref:Uncharacterized protein n=1 Tax=Clostridium collagenovorans DSM 3089 TaxID=1121306 RepID=A0A1M5X792_9CLOT|nr:hypothetical protein [Clostridium collagenovorans]SHH95659.1 hypothetical protein SAMN02745196_02068 [Clostridium collagenovorans DSM 3089]